MTLWAISDIVVITNPVSALLNSSSDGLDISGAKQAYPYEGCCQHTRMCSYSSKLHSSFCLFMCLFVCLPTGMSEQIINNPGQHFTDG